MPTYAVEHFSGGAYGFRHRFIQRFNVEADSEWEAAKEADLPLYRDAGPTDAYCHVTEVKPLPADGSCPRCGSQRSACGGPTDPHE